MAAITEQLSTNKQKPEDTFMYTRKTAEIANVPTTPPVLFLRILH